jgi:predicted  nucleic acid-binding Zn-ribbon protein
MTKGADLYRLQCLDREGDERRRRLTEVEAALGESEALNQARRSLESVQALVKKWALRQRDLELQTQGVTNKISRSEQRLYSGAVTNPKELTELQSEVAALRRRRQKLEDDLLAAMIELEETQDAQVDAQRHLDQTQAQWTAQQADLTAERDKLQDKLAEIERMRTQVLPKIDAADLANYQTLRHRKSGLAVVEVRNGACGGCGLAVPPSLEWQLRHEEVGTCSNCGRIIVRV